MNTTKIVDLYTKTLQLEDATVFLRMTDKDIWAEIRKELAGTTKKQREEIWGAKLEAMVEAKYKSEPNAFIVKKYRGRSMYAETWRRRRGKAKWRFVNCFQTRPKPQVVAAEPTHDHTTVIIRVKKPMGGWDADGILAGLENLYTRIPNDVLDPLVARAKEMSARRRRAAA